MQDWNSGYVTEIDYTHGYYPELNPARSKLGVIHSGVRVPEIRTACELGFGQGISTNIHAAASSTEWWGTDFIPSQTSFAQELSSVAQSDARLYDESFADFCSRTDLPDFDFICLHGIWSWISDDNRATVIDFIRRKLRVGGILYMSYNTMPGWATYAPMRHLFNLHSEIMSSKSEGISKRIESALQFATDMFECEPAFKRANPNVEEWLKKIAGQPRNYLAHEYFNKNWNPMHFSTIASSLGDAKLDFACSANYLDHFNKVNFSKEQQALLEEIPDLVLRESVRDFIVNQQFRKDYWIKGARKFSPTERLEILAEQRFILTKPRDSVSLKFKTVQGEVTMSENTYAPILEVLSDHKAIGIKDLQAEAAKLNNAINHRSVIEALMVLSSRAYVSPVQNDDLAAQAQSKTARLNKYVVDQSRFETELTYLASPVTGGGVKLSRMQQLYLGEYMKGSQSPQEIAKLVWQEFARQGVRLVKEGKELQSAEDNLNHLASETKAFTEKFLPILKALGIA